MSILYNRLSGLCERKGITGYRMAKDTNISTSLMTDLKMGRKKSISAEVADKLATYFEVSVGYLLGTEEVLPLSVLSERIDGLCAQHKITGYRLCKDIGISPNVLTELRSGRRKGMSAKNADKIASYFGVSVGYLLGTEDKLGGGIMSNLYKRIEDLCVKKGTNITQMCKESGASRASLTDLKMGRKQSLSATTLLKISTYLDVSVGYLLGTEDDPGIKKAPVQPDGGEEEFMQLFRRLSPEVQERELAYLRQLAEHEAAQDK